MADSIATQVTARSVTFWVPGIPVQWSVEARIQRGGKGIFPQLYVRDELRAWKRHVQAVAGRNRPRRLLAGPIWLALLFVMRPPEHAIGWRDGSPYLKRLVPLASPDLTNLAKSTEDGLSGIIFDDDRLVVETRARKVYADPGRNQGPGVLVSARELTDVQVMKLAGRIA